jgi:tRNA uridine 5-carbamoylmethylation protein Kti12
MPSLIITGHPCSGKTTLAIKLREIALKHPSIDHVIIINEESEGLGRHGDSEGDGHRNDDKNDAGATSGSSQQQHPLRESYYTNQLAEKQTRGTLKAAFDRVVGRKDTLFGCGGGGDSTPSKRRTLVILDSMNYIKGFRYELHCISKAAGEQHGVLWVLNRRAAVEEWNKHSNHYSSHLLQELISRYEPPDDRNRWDKPLFTVDVAPVPPPSSASGAETETTTASSTTAQSSTNTTDAASEALQNSVYNMHTLSDVLIGGGGAGAAAGKEPTTKGNDDNNKTQQQDQTKVVPKKKSAFSRAATSTKSAFTKKIPRQNQQLHHQRP